MKKSQRIILYLVVHCTATREGQSFRAADIDRWHKEKGWKGIGYNYVIGLDGKLEFGRDVDAIPSHVKGYNENSLGIVYVGGLDKAGKPKDTRTPQQIQVLLSLLIELKRIYPYAKILGHRDFHNVNKACPSFHAREEYFYL